jgi:hypothetical protein
MTFVAHYPPTAVTGISGSLDQVTNVLTLTWTAPSDMGTNVLQSYKIERD